MNAVLARLCASNSAAPQTSDSAAFVRPVRSLVAKTLSADPDARAFELRDLAAVIERLLGQLASAKQNAEDTLVALKGHASVVSRGEGGYYSTKSEQTSNTVPLRLWRKRKTTDEVTPTEISHLGTLLTENTTLRDLVLAISRRELKLRQVQATTARQSMAYEDELSKLTKRGKWLGSDTIIQGQQYPTTTSSQRRESVYEERRALAQALEERLASLEARAQRSTGRLPADTFTRSGI